MKLIVSSKDKIKKCFKLCKIEQTELGKPYLSSKHLNFSKSYSNHLGVILLNYKSCGVDIEHIREFNKNMVLKVCSLNEIEFLDKTIMKDYYFTLLWVLKESYLKFTGQGLSYPMKKISFVVDGKLMLKFENCIFKYYDYENYIISICVEV